MAKKQKCVVLRGKRKRMQVCCKSCGDKKVIEYRRNGRGERLICGAQELTKPAELP